MRPRPTVSMIVAAVVLAASAAFAQQGAADGEWRSFAGDLGSTKYSTLDQIDADNVGTLRVAWRRPLVDAAYLAVDPELRFSSVSRAAPVIVDGVGYVPNGIGLVEAFDLGTGDTRWTQPPFGGPDELRGTGTRGVAYWTDGTSARILVQRGEYLYALDPDTGETIWAFREPETVRFLRSPRRSYGKGVAYAEVNGRGVIYITTPAFFLWALDAKTGRPLENWGAPVPLDDFEQTGVVDLVPELLEDWGQWERWDEGPYDADYGVPRELGMVTASAPPIVVNGVVVVLVGHQPSYGQTRIENIPGDIMGFDARTGERLWKFHVIPRPGEFGHETWENDAWEWTGDVSSWAPMTADPELGLVYVVTNGVTIDYYGGHHPGDNLFSTSVIALDAETGERRWQFNLLSPPWSGVMATAGGLVFGGSQEGNIFALDADSGEPLWSFYAGAATRTNPMSYQHAGKQYVVMSGGYGVFVFGLKD